MPVKKKQSIIAKRARARASQRACRARKKESGRSRCEITDPWPKDEHVPLIKAYAKKLEEDDHE